MGQHHIFSISEDAINLNKERKDDLEIAIGKAVTSLCGNRPIVSVTSGPDPVVVESRDILNCGNTIRRAGDVHYTETAVFVWSGARLKRLQELEPHELEEVSQLVSAAVSNRTTNP